jgi:hypothetical protein
MKPSSGVPGRADTLSGIPELASAEDPCARRARIWLRAGKSSIGWQRRVCTSSRGLLSAFAASSFSSAKQRVQSTSKARRTVSTDERMSPSARPFEIARLSSAHRSNDKLSARRARSRAGATDQPNWKGSVGNDPPITPFSVVQWIISSAEI